MAQAAALPGAARLELVDGVIHLDPKPALFDAMLTGWVRQQQTRFLSEQGTIKPRVALVRRVADRDPLTGEALWSAPFELPEDYLERHVQLAYAGNVHVAQSRTVDTAHLVVDEVARRAGFYVGMSRGSERNTAYVVTEQARAADP